MKKLLLLSKACQRISRQSHYQDPEIVQRQLRSHAKQLYQEAHKHHRRLKLLALARTISTHLKGILPLGLRHQKSSKKVLRFQRFFPGKRPKIPPFLGIIHHDLETHKPSLSYE